MPHAWLTQQHASLSYVNGPQAAETLIFSLAWRNQTSTAHETRRTSKKLISWGKNIEDPHEMTPSLGSAQWASPVARDASRLRRNRVAARATRG
jgi:hypothetical protein